MRGLLHCYYWCDEGLQNTLNKAGLPRLSRTKSMIMVNIADGIARPSDLARNIGVTRQAIQQTLVEMERDGLVTLEPDPSDGRAKIVRFSRRGAGIGKAAFEAMDQIEAELVRRLGADTVKSLRKILFREWGPVVHVPDSETEVRRPRNSAAELRRKRA